MLNFLDHFCFIPPTLKNQKESLCAPATEKKRKPKIPPTLKGSWRKKVRREEKDGFL